MTHWWLMVGFMLCIVVGMGFTGSVWYDENCNILIDGKPFFPRELYRVYSEEDYQDCKACGFNASFASTKEYFDRALKYGFVATLSGFYGADEQLTAERLEKIREMILMAREHPALLGYYMIDEPDIRGDNCRPSTYKSLKAFVKTLDTAHPCMVTITNGGREPVEFAKLADIIRLDPYPVFNRRPLMWSWECIERVRAATGGAKPIIHILQAWTAPPPSRLPEPWEDRFETYLALIHGANGISHYAYRFSDRGPTEVLKETKPELWEGMVKINQELIALEDVLLEPLPAQWYLHVCGKQGRADALLKEHEGELYILALNIMSDDNTVSFSIYPPLDGVAEVMFKDGGTVQVKDGKFEDQFKGYEEKVYRIKISNANLLPEAGVYVPHIYIDTMRPLLKGIYHVFVLNRSDKRLKEAEVHYQTRERWEGKICDKGTLPGVVGAHSSIKRYIECPILDFECMDLELDYTIGDKPVVKKIYSKDKTLLSIEELGIEFALGFKEETIIVGDEALAQLRITNDTPSSITDLKILPWPSDTHFATCLIRGVDNIGAGENAIAEIKLGAPLDTANDKITLNCDITFRYAGKKYWCRIERELPIKPALKAEIKEMRVIAESGKANLDLSIQNNLSKEYEILLKARFTGGVKGVFYNKTAMTRPMEWQVFESAVGSRELLAQKLLLKPGNNHFKVEVPVHNFDEGIYNMDLLLYREGNLTARILWNLVVPVLAPYLEDAPVVDGDLSEWIEKAKHIHITPQSSQINHLINPDFFTDCYFAWDENNFYMGFIVPDKEHVQTHKGDTIWWCDSIQVGFDPLCDGKIEDVAYRADDYEYGFALTQDGECVYCWKAGQYGSDGLVEGMNVVIKRDGDKKVTTYEIAMPWKFITPVVGEKGAHFRIGMIINNNDGEGRGWMDWTFSMVGEKKPYAFVDIFLK